MAILVTGGAGYIGSHTCLELLSKGYDVVVVDNLSNSSEESLKRVEKLAGKDLTFYQFNVEDKDKLIKVFEQEKIQAVIHFAGLKAVGESVHKPLNYYYNNLVSTLVLCEVMTQFDVKKLVFSSSATVYGNPQTVPIKEDFPLSVTNPYGRTKLMQEEMLRDLVVADREWKIILLRYFNPIGADQSGMIGEDPLGIPNNLVPYITQVAVGKLKELQVFGDDYDTKDGSGVRDYIHVTDLAIGHVKSIEKLSQIEGVKTYNLGTGKGYSVLEMVAAFSEVCKKPIPYVVKERRPGDIATCFADPSLAKEELGFVAEKKLSQMCEDAYRWQCNNPNGYRD
ncbi:UDP-glucose 4-epimerase [Anaerosporobacter mobilis DSM 15930]|jgi:UDP-glucose 4-epimerase|uniref:UDP-glucose 4-epimerase n=1 Tax=Anaerosporobacter mobilis DSM 15930 TaxID=1120996 RepID=A0A1M7JG39_9FIRM|nr:UDP-glucose 4-epimerase GalE [Anaerosporobacter mobilis]SHM52002.1 UDP-glucose 4-epimerase [Anaerosporobacter mobilis DSM 15930]